MGRTVGIGILMSFLTSTVVAQTVQLPGRVGTLEDWNVTWLDLSAVRNFAAGQTLHLAFQGPDPKEVVVRFVPVGCSNGSPCEISCEVQHIQNHQLIVKLTQDYTAIRQISVHSGVSGSAFQCAVDGGPISTLTRVGIQ
jgi:hypothetical protein